MKYGHTRLKLTCELMRKYRQKDKLKYRKKTQTEYNSEKQNTTQNAIFDIRALWRSAPSVRVPRCQKLQMMA